MVTKIKTYSTNGENSSLSQELKWEILFTVKNTQNLLTTALTSFLKIDIFLNIPMLNNTQENKKEKKPQRWSWLTINWDLSKLLTTLPILILWPSLLMSHAILIQDSVLNVTFQFFFMAKPSTILEERTANCIRNGSEGHLHSKILDVLD